MCAKRDTKGVINYNVLISIEVRTRGTNDDKKRSTKINEKKHRKPKMSNRDPIKKNKKM